MRIATFLFSFFIFAAANAEIVQGIIPYKSLGEIKAIFPNAIFKKVDAAWVTEDDGFYEMSGPGLSGTYMLAFADPRRARRQLEMAFRAKAAEINNPDYANYQENVRLADTYKNWGAETDDVAQIISWVRWLPPSAIPLARYTAKYGKPDKSGFDDETMRPYRNWPKRGIKVLLADNERDVILVNFFFTPTEILAACKTRVDPINWKSLCK